MLYIKIIYIISKLIYIDSYKKDKQNIIKVLMKFTSFKSLKNGFNNFNILIYFNHKL